MADEWRNLIYLRPGFYVAVEQMPNGIPARGTEVTFLNEPRIAEAGPYWKLREGWRTLGTDAFDALYQKWQPKRDAILGKEEYLSKSRAEWERFYLALADERAAREYAAGRVSADFGLDGKELLKAMQMGGRAG